MDESLAVKLADTDARARSNTRRIDKLESDNAALNRLATSVEVMATKQVDMSDKLDRLDGKVETMESKPGKRWESIVEKCIWAFVGGVIMFLLAQIGIT